MTINRQSCSVAMLVFGLSGIVGGKLSAQGFVIQHGPALSQDGVGAVPFSGGFLIGARAFEHSPDRHAAGIWTAGADGSDQGTSIVNEIPGKVFLQGMIASADGGLFLHGSAIPEHGHEHDGFIIKRGLDGSMAWTATLPMDGDQHYLGAAALPDGGVVVCGTTNSSGDHDALIARFDANGAMSWMAAEGFELDEEAYAVAVQANDILVTGRQLNFGGTSDAWFARLSLDGEVLWTTSWGGIANDIGRSIVPLGPGSFVMAGTTNSFGPYDHTEHRIKDNIYLIAIDLNGDSLWTRTVGDTIYDRRAFDLAVTENGELLISGERSAVIGESDSQALRTSMNGSLIWERTWDLGKEERLLAIEPLPDGFVATGWSFGEWSRQVTLVRKDPNGN